MLQSHRQSGLQFVTERFSQLLIFSPHMDDAVLSCGGFINSLSQKLKCTTVTLCTADPDLAPNQAAPHGIALPSERRHEEVAAMKALGCELIQLDFLDAIYRKDPKSQSYLYPTLDSLWTMPVAADLDHRNSLLIMMKEILSRCDSVPTMILAPAGVGHHVDHILCTQNVLSLAPDINSVFLYEDFPYVVDQGEHVGISDSIDSALDRLNVRGVERFEIHSDIDAKVSLILNYPSQLETIFGSSENIHSVLERSGVAKTAVERFWRVEHKN